MAIQLFDTLSRQLKPLQASDGNHFRFYCCGPTVYGPAHIGNFRTFLLQDVLRRMLEIQGLNPIHVRNLTDVDDKTIRGSQQKGLSLKNFTEEWTEIFHADCKALNMLPPHIEPTATGHIPQMIEMIQVLIKKKHAYVAPDGSVYYKIDSFKDYGKLSHLNKEALKTQETTSAGATNTADEYTRDSIADFALWKSYKPEDGPNAWETPWGKGRPGWHIECSAMCKQHLGDTFDLHAGGIDLCFPHHENEIAQSEGANSEDANKHPKPLALHWFHTAHLQVDGQKMSKSLGNLYTLKDIEQKGFSPNVLRYVLISGHYRQPLNFTLESLHAAQSAIKKIEKAIQHLLQMAGIPFSYAQQFQDTIQYSSTTPASQRFSVGGQKLETPSTSDPYALQFKNSARRTSGEAEERIVIRDEAESRSSTTQKLEMQCIENTFFKRSWDALCHDLNTPEAIGHLFTAIHKLEATPPPSLDLQKEINALFTLLYALGITISITPPLPQGFSVGGVPTTIPSEIEALAQKRWDAKTSKNFALSDELRKEIETKGWKVLDHPNTYSLEPIGK